MTTATTSRNTSIVKATRDEWKAQLDALPTLEENGGKIPSIFLAHGQPFLLAHKSATSGRMGALMKTQGPNGALANFLEDLGPALINKYHPRAIVVFSAHWEEGGFGKPIGVLDYKGENPLLMDYYGFDDHFYKIKFESYGDSSLVSQITGLLSESDIKSKVFSNGDARGKDGRPFADDTGLDHGVFVPFRIMFGEKSPIPIVQVSIDSTLDPEAEWKLGKALAPLRSEGVLIISGGLTIHTFKDFGAFDQDSATDIYKQFETAIIDSVDAPENTDSVARKQALVNLTQHPGFRLAHPREEHFVPLYIAAGASDDGVNKATVLSGIHGAKTIAFGI